MASSLHLSTDQQFLTLHLTHLTTIVSVRVAEGLLALWNEIVPKVTFFVLIQKGITIFSSIFLSGLVAACDDGHLRVWKIPDEGLLSPTNDPELDFPAHSDKIQMVKFHPLAKDVLLTVAFDKSVKIWNLNDISEPAIELNVRLIFKCHS